MSTFNLTQKSAQSPACACGGTCPKCGTGRSDPRHERREPRTVHAGEIKAATGSGGRPLNLATRSDLEDRFGRDFSEVPPMLRTHSRNPHVGLTTDASRFGTDFSQIPIHALASGAIQTKLAINKPGDEYEQEADRVADRVMRTPEPRAQRACECGGTCEGCKKKESQPLQMKSVNGTGSPPVKAPQPSAHELVRSPGQPLETATRAFMEPRFGRDFSDVRIHTDTRAAESAGQIHSRAFTVGSSIVFGSGNYAPATTSGRHLLAHELTHVLQQRGGAGFLDPIHPGIIGGSGPSGLIQRHPDDGSGKERPRPVEPPMRWPYGDTELSAEGIRIRRANRDKSGDWNLVVFKFSWRKTDERGPVHEPVFEHIWNRPEVAHSEQELDQYFRSFKAGKGGNVEIVVHGIFSERQFCGPSNQNCQKLIYKSYPDAKKEFAYNYQMPPGTRRAGWENTRNVIRQRIEAFRDSGEGIDESTWRDPDPFDEVSGGRIPGQVGRRPKKPTSGATSTEKQAPVGGESQRTTTEKVAEKSPPPPTQTSTPDTPAETKPTGREAEKPSSRAPVQVVPRKPAPQRTVPKAPPTQQPPPKSKAVKPEVPAKPATRKGMVGEPVVEPSVDVGGSGARGKLSSAATRAVGIALQKANAKINEIARKNSGDKDLAAALDYANTALEIKNFAHNPLRYGAQAFKNSLIQGVFRHYSVSLAAARQKFIVRFPDVATLHQDPVNTGTSLEDYATAYNQAVLGLRIPDARKAVWYVFVLVGTDERTPQAELERRITIANEKLATLPGLSDFFNKYHDARDRYAFALLAHINKLFVLKEDWAKEPQGLVDELQRRGHVLVKVGSDLGDMATQLEESDAVYVPILGEAILDLAMDLQMLGEGFESLGSQFHEFADIVGDRMGEYDREINRTQKQQKAMMNFLTRSLIPD